MDDPYKSFQFRIKWDGRYVAGVSKVSALKRATQPIAHRGSDPNVRRISMPKHEPITLERGVTHDPEFAKWANTAHSEQHVTLKNTRRDLSIDVFGEAGQQTQSYQVRAAWVSAFASQFIVTDPTALAIESITLEHEGWVKS